MEALHSFFLTAILMIIAYVLGTRFGPMIDAYKAGRALGRGKNQSCLIALAAMIGIKPPTA